MILNHIFILFFLNSSGHKKQRTNFAQGKTFVQLLSFRFKITSKVLLVEIDRKYFIVALNCWRFIPQQIYWFYITYYSLSILGALDNIPLISETLLRFHEPKLSLKFSSSHAVCYFTRSPITDKHCTFFFFCMQ